jgi:hypothetical protein
MRSGTAIAVVLAVFLGLTGSLFTDQASAGATVSIHPQVTYASPGQFIRVYIWKDIPDTLFDGYETVIRFNPSDLQLQAGAAEESVMTNNCGNRWWYTSPGSGTIFISHVRMCPPNTLVTGPGALSSLSFKVLREGRLVITRDYFWFTRAGYWIKDVTWQDGIVLSGASAGVEDGIVAEPGSVRVLVSPNPGHEISVTVQWPAHIAPRAGSQSLCVYDIEGRLVRTLLKGSAGSDAADTFAWDGTDVLGKVCSPGVYYLSCESGGLVVSKCVVLVR